MSSSERKLENGKPMMLAIGIGGHEARDGSGAVLGPKPEGEVDDHGWEKAAFEKTREETGG
jgi:hypothetical protein